MRPNALLASLLILVLAGATVASSADETCRADGGSSTEKQAATDTLEPTKPGPWRQGLKLRPARERQPGTRTAAPSDPLSTETITRGRWLPGYRPATEKARAELEAWRARQAATLGTAGASAMPNRPSSNYAANLMSGARVDFVPDEPITYEVRPELYPVSSVDLRRLPVGEQGEVSAAEEKNGEPEGDLEFDPLSGMTWEEFLWIKRQAESAPETVDGQTATPRSARAPGFDGVSFDAIVSNITGAPPDPIMAVGPNHLVAIVNSRYRVWDKTGAPLIDEITLGQFFNGVAHCGGVFDVYVDYDEAFDRFVMGGMALESGSGTDAYLCLAASATNDPTGVWNRTVFRADAAVPQLWIDFPHMGIGLDAIYIAGNMFADGGGLDSVRAYAVDKFALYQGQAAQVAEAGLGSLFFTAQPAKLHGYVSGGWPAPGSPHPIIAHDGGGNSRIWHWESPFSTAPVVYGTIAEASFGGIPPSAAELGAAAGGLNDTGSAKWLDAEVRGGRLWATRNVACNLGGGGAESCIDWIEVDISGPTPVLVQQQTGGAYGSAGDFRYYPDLSIDRNGNVAIGYTKSSASTYTQVWVTGREAGDAAGELQSETLLRAGLGNYTDGSGCQGACDRWGDYTGLTVDPDGCTFWYLGQYSDGGAFNWGTHIGSFRFASCSTDALLQIDKGSYTCDDTITVTVTDSIPIDAAAVAAATTVSTSGGDVETIPAGSWSGSDCSAGFCGTWTAALAVSGAPGSPDDGTVNVGDAETITVVYADPHPSHQTRSRNAAATCATRLADGGYLTVGGCEGGQGGETYRDYMDGGEFIAYTFGIYNPPAAPALSDVEAELVVTGPAADKVTVFNPTIRIGAMAPGQLTAPVFTLYIDPSIDAPGLRMSEHDFNLVLTSVADGFTEPQVLTQTHLLQADDNIVSESQCFNLESGTEGFVEARYQYLYICQAAVCGTLKNVRTTEAPWSRGPGCGSETRTDDPRMTCDAGGANAFMTNADPAVCNNFAQTDSTIVDTVLYSPIFAPVHTGLAANGQPWSYDWRFAEWYYRSDMVSFIDPAMVLGMFWDDGYQGVATPAVNEINDYYRFFYGYFYYPNQGWDSGTPWDPQALPANVDSVAFGNARGLATPGLQWRWAVEVYDADYGGNPLATPATQGLAIDNLNLVYNQYHAEEQLGACLDPIAVVSFDRYSYLQCPGDQLRISVLDGLAGGSVLVTAESESTLDSETFRIDGTGPHFTKSLAYSTGAGPRANDGVLWVAPTDRIRVTYHGGAGSSPVAYAYVGCEGGDVVVDGVAALVDNGDHDAYADTNETVDLSIRIRNSTGQPLQNVVAIVDTDDPSIDCVTKNVASFGTIAAGATGTNDLSTDPFIFKVSGAVACANPLAPPTATFRVLILADGFGGPNAPQSVTLTLDLNDLPGAVTLVENFDGGSHGFVHQLGPGDDDGAAVNPNGFACSPYEDRFFWRGSGGNTGGGFFCWKNPADDFPNGDYGDLSDSALYSPVFKIDATGTTLSFDHEYLFGYSGSYRVDGARVDYRVNGGTWRKLTTLPYDGTLIWNTYCNPLCNASELGAPCFTEELGTGERIFNQLDQGAVNWTNVSGAVSGLSPGDTVQFRWRVGSMRSSDYGISTLGGYGLDNIQVTNVIRQTCDAAPHPDVGCGLVFDGFDNLVELCGDGDALVEPTERWSVDVRLRNSSAAPAVDAIADLTPSGGSRNPASVIGNPGSFGTIAAEGGTATASYDFVVGASAECIEEVLFDLTSIAEVATSYPDQPSVFALPVGGIGAQQTAQQSVDPLSVSDGTVASALAPALGVPVPAFSATLDYDPSYTNVTPVQTETQVTSPLVAENNTVTTLLGAPIAISPDTVVSAVVDWTSLAHDDALACTRVFLRTPSGANWTLKAIGSPAANPYNVLTVYRNPAGGAGQYQIGLEEVASGPCRRQATLTGATLTVTDESTTGSFLANAKVSLWDGSNEYVIKPFGAADAAPYDITTLYNAAGPGGYEIRLEENGAGGIASLAGAAITATGIQCDAGCASFVSPAPPVGDGIHGTPMTASRGAGPNDVEIALDNATCSGSRAVVVYGTIGDWNGYQGAATGCDLGTGPSGTVTLPAGNVWFNVIWVNADEAAGHPGYASGGTRSWDAAGLCGVVADDPSDGVCN